MGIYEALDHLIDRIESINPKTDAYHHFVCIKDAQGNTLSLESRSNQNRLFDIAFNALAQDDGQAGISGRKRIDLSVRVRYDIGGDRGLLERMIA